MGDSRNHLLEVAHRRFDIFTGGDVVLDLVDERRLGDTSRVARCGVLAVEVGEKIWSAWCAATNEVEETYTAVSGFFPAADIVKI